MDSNPEWCLCVSLHFQNRKTVAKFIVPDWGDIVHYAIGLLYRPARLHWMAGRHYNLKLELTIFPYPETMNLHTGCCNPGRGHLGKSS